MEARRERKKKNSFQLWQCNQMLSIMNEEYVFHCRSFYKIYLSAMIPMRFAKRVIWIVHCTINCSTWLILKYCSLKKKYEWMRRLESIRMYLSIQLCSYHILLFMSVIFFLPFTQSISFQSFPVHNPGHSTIIVVISVGGWTLHISNDWSNFKQTAPSMLSELYPIWQEPIHFPVSYCHTITSS